MGFLDFFSGKSGLIKREENTEMRVLMVMVYHYFQLIKNILMLIQKLKFNACRYSPPYRE